MLPVPLQLDPYLTTWHITWGSYGTRLHGGHLPTVDCMQNKRGDPFITFNDIRYIWSQESLRFPPVALSLEQRRFIEDQIPLLCKRGGWVYRECAAKEDHVHSVVDIDPAIHGQRVRRLLKRWVTQAMDPHWPRLPDTTWWAEQGSNRVVDSLDYLRNVIPYVRRQRAPRDD